jgi:hypothetical protein
MADIDQIIAGGAGASSRVDFSKLADLPSYYWKGRDEYAKNDLRDAFRGGVPIGADGQPDFAEISKTFFQKGDISNGIAAANLDLQRQNLRFGQSQSQDIRNVEGGSQPGQPPIVSPPSPNRSGTATVAPPLNRGGAQPQAAAPQGGSTIMQILTAQGIPNDQLGAASASVARQLGVEDPNAPIDVSDPRVRNVIVPAVQQLKRMGIGQVVPNGPTPAPQPQVAQAAPQGQPSPVTSQVTSAAAPATPSRAEQLIAYYSGIMSDPRSPKQNVELAKTRLEALQKSNDLTPDQKNYAQAKLEGFQGTFQDFLADAESRKTAATEEAKLGAQKYQSLVEAGTKAQMEIPQLDLLKEQMNDPNFFSGAGEKYNLLYKRLKSAVGIDPEAAVPQEYLRKATAANVLSSLGALKGLGQIRVAEINMAREAAASPENSIPANKLLVEISKRTHERNAQIAEMAQDYKERNGVLDAGFDKKVTAYYKKNPLFTDAEIKDWHKVIGKQKAAKQASSAPQFSSPADVHAAVAAGKLKSGDSFVDANGKTRYVP